jgi:hypothetical protein
MSYTSFKKMKAELAGKPGVNDPAAVSASIARKKYGKEAVQHAAETGTSLKGKPTKRRRMIQGFVKRHG